MNLLRLLLLVSSLEEIRVANPLHEILDGLYASFEQWVAASRQDPSEIEIVWNEDLDRFRDPEKEFKIKWIVVGHNPGDQERGAANAAGLWIGRYFHPEGSTGSWTRLILAHDVRYLERQVLFLEKTPICSGNVQGLRPKKIHFLFNQLQERMAEAVYDLQEATGAFVWIQGGPNPTPEDNLFVPFFRNSANSTATPQRSKCERRGSSRHIIWAGS